MSFAKHILTLSVLFLSFLLKGQEMTVRDYIMTYRGIAVEKMEQYGIPASITLAQGILESASGNSQLARNANNHFGIKCHKGWTGKTYYQDDDEKDECFRKYSSPVESFRDHSLFLTTRDRYATLFDLEVTDYKGWAKGLKKAGYATNPRYPDLLIRIIEENRLYEYDKKGIGYAKTETPEAPATGKTDIPAPEFSLREAEISYMSESGRKVYENNGVPFVLSEKGDTPRDIAKEFGIYTWQVYKYNEISRKVPLMPGQPVYLEKKKRRADKQYPTHVMQPGENIFEVAQLYGIRLKQLYRLNDLGMDDEPRPGDVLRLR